MYIIITLGIFYATIAILTARKMGTNYITPHAYYTVHKFIPFFVVPLIQVFLFPDLYTTSGLITMNLVLAVSYLFYTIGFFITQSGHCRYFWKIHI